jgi:hypothetical protein
VEVVDHQDLDLEHKQVYLADLEVVDQDIQVQLVLVTLLLQVQRKEMLVEQDVMTMQQLVEAVEPLVVELLLHTLRQDEEVQEHQTIF